MKNGYSICFNEWALDKEIKNELGLLLIISSLCAEKGYCYASNKYLSDLFDTNETTISRKIKLLEEKNYINIEYEMRGCEIKSRKIRLSKMIIDDYQKNQSTIIKNDKENNISINNININNIIKEKNNKKEIEEIINYLNEKLKTKYKSSTPKTQQLIKARLNEGFTIDDFMKVIDNKCNDWFNNEKMNQYLRPETLFGTKFENYLNQKTKHRDTEEEILKYLEENNK